MLRFIYKNLWFTTFSYIAYSYNPILLFHYDTFAEKLSWLQISNSKPNINVYKKKKNVTRSKCNSWVVKGQVTVLSTVHIAYKFYSLTNCLSLETDMVWEIIKTFIDTECSAWYIKINIIKWNVLPCTFILIDTHKHLLQL